MGVGEGEEEAGGIEVVERQLGGVGVLQRHETCRSGY